MKFSFQQENNTDTIPANTQTHARACTHIHFILLLDHSSMVTSERYFCHLAAKPYVWVPIFVFNVVCVSICLRGIARE